MVSQQSIAQPEKPRITLSIPATINARPSNDSSNEADSEGSTDLSAYVSANTSFSEAFEIDDLPEPCFPDQSLCVTSQDRAECFARPDGSARPSDSGLEQSSWEDCLPSPLTKHVSRGGQSILHSQRISVPGHSLGSADYDVQYKPGATATNLHRKVVLSGLKASCSLSQVLAQVRGGLLIEASLLDTVQIIGTKSVMISFLEERSAIAFVNHVNKRLFKIDDQKVIANLVSTPSWPLSFALKRAIRVHHHTRCLKIEGFPREVLPSTIRSDLEFHPALKLSTIEAMEMDTNHSLGIRFASVMAAQQAFDNLSLQTRYRGCRVAYAVDPCILPLNHVE